MSNKPSRKTNSQNKDGSGAHVDQIRDIIFGDTMRQYEERFAVMERKLNSMTSNLSNDLDRRLERIEVILRKEVDKLKERLTKDREKSTLEAKARKQAMDELEGHVEGRLEELDGELTKEYQVLQSAVSDHSEAVVQMIDETRYQLDEAIAKQAEALDNDKISRSDLAQMFTEFAKHLRGNK